MNFLLIYAYLFFIGSLLGWGIEVLFRRFFSLNNPEKKWINPGFCVGPYLPLYGVGLCVLYAMAIVGTNAGLTDRLAMRLVLYALMSLSMTVIEYISGLLALKWLKLRLWDYSNEWANLNGLICPKFSLFWAMLSALYFFLIHPRILNGLRWLADNLAFSFFIGFFFGVFVIDVVYSCQIVAKMKQFAEENQVVVRFEQIKAHIRSAEAAAKEKNRFLFPFRGSRALSDYLKEVYEMREERRRGKDAETDGGNAVRADENK